MKSSSLNLQDPNKRIFLLLITLSIALLVIIILLIFRLDFQVTNSAPEPEFIITEEGEEMIYDPSLISEEEIESIAEEYKGADHEPHPEAIDQ